METNYITVKNDKKCSLHEDRAGTVYLTIIENAPTITKGYKTRQIGEGNSLGIVQKIESWIYYKIV